MQIKLEEAIYWKLVALEGRVGQARAEAARVIKTAQDTRDIVLRKVCEEHGLNIDLPMQLLDEGCVISQENVNERATGLDGGDSATIPDVVPSVEADSGLGRTVDPSGSDRIRRDRFRRVLHRNDGGAAHDNTEFREPVAEFATQEDSEQTRR